jgi:hypothetical protein
VSVPSPAAAALKVLIELEKRLTDQGKLIEAGWVGFRIATIASDAPPNQLDEMRVAFFGGATHLFTALMRIIDGPVDEITADEMKRMELINKELGAFVTEMERRAGAGGEAFGRG